ncbi:alpha-2-macroglobulin family protein [Pseudooceanicola algae]|uniref:Alpha-2-macroglobulin n=1 Tax=Pseudooceanicola algae TaxID=1537215 RepID=A0A418SAV9_9RHOB|nr:alpha-2-macroglobulin family protein [Pseudooceanicola algae]QPM91257.1 Alpha-2-macroglobulin [Pseudooceanicola algae]
MTPRSISAGIAALLLGLAPMMAEAQDLSPLPGHRAIVQSDTDLVGRDLQQIFDTTPQACLATCIADVDCTALTFNQRNNSCFPKTDVIGERPYDGALSAAVRPTAAQAMDLARSRARDLRFLGGERLDAARDLARTLPWLANTPEVDAEDLRARASDAARALRMEEALRWGTSAVAVSDTSGDWEQLASFLMAQQVGDRATLSAHRARALSAAVNAYLRAPGDGARAQALLIMAQALRSLDEGAQMIPALTLAQDLSNRADIAEMLIEAQALYGFRVTDDEVQADRPDPRICVSFSAALARSGVDYATYLRLPDAGMAVESSGNEICVTGGRHGHSYALTFRAGLPGADGQQLHKDFELRSHIPDRTPTARFPGRGYVLPRGAGAALPVQTVNLDTLDLTLFRVTDRNLLRSIQDSYFGEDLGDYSLDTFSEEIAAQIWTGTAELRKERNQSVTTRLPMAEALSGQPAGIYALRAEVPGGDDYMHPLQWFVLTDLGLSVMTGTDGLHAVVRGLSDAGGREDVMLTLLSRANDVLAEAQTDPQGLASFAAGLTRGTGGAAPAALIARSGDDLAFLSLTGPAFDLSDRGVEGRAPAAAIDMFLATDRGAYRAGEVIHLTALARDGTARAIDGLPVTAILKRPDGVEYARLSRASGLAGGYAFDFPTGPGVTRGTWRIEVKSDLDAPALATQSVLIEDFLPERLEFDVALPDGPLSGMQTHPLSIEARYLFGAPAADLVVEGDYRLRPLSALPDFPGYRFGLHDAETRGDRQYFDMPATGAGGRSETGISLAGYEPDLATVSEATFTIAVREGSGRAVERQIRRIVAPDAPVIGIRPRQDDIPQGGEAVFDLIALGPDLTPQAMEAHYRINRVTTRYQWYRQWGEWQWEAFTTRTPVMEGDVMLGETPVQVSAPVDWGRYEIVVEALDNDRTSSSTDFNAGWYVPADVTTTPDMLDVSLDAESFRVGDSATLRVVPRHGGTALVSVLSNRLIDMKIVELTEGSNEITLEVTEDWGAGAYVSATLLRPMDVAAGHNPARALGLAYAAVDPGAKALEARFETPEASDPRGPLAAVLHVDGLSAGDTAHATVAAVDLGILNLTGFQTPDPQDHYFGQRRLGVEMRDLYGRLIDGLEGEMGRLRSGGDAMAMSTQAPPPTEDLLAYFSGPVTIGPDGTARLDFDIPDFNGTVRLAALVWSETGVASAEADVLVRDPVVLTASLPRFLSPGDVSRVLIELQHVTGPAGAVSLALDAGGLQIDTTGLPVSIDLAEKGKASFRLPVSASAAGDYRLHLDLTTPDGRVLSREVTLPVRRLAPEIAITSRLDLAPGETFTLNADAFDGLYPDSARGLVSTGTLARYDVPGLLSYLGSYPFGCTEQLTSRSLPLLYLSSVATEIGQGSEAELRAQVGDSITAILARQAANGSFALWPGAEGGGWLDAYVTDFLSRARTAGYEVPDLAFARALNNLRNKVNYAADFTPTENGGGAALAYQLLVLAREGEAAIGDLRYYADVKAGDFGTPLAQAQIGAALASYGDQIRADRLFAAANARLSQAVVPGLLGGEAQVFRADFGTDLRDAAGVLALAGEAGSTVVDRAALSARLAESKGPLSTQESAFTLMAAEAQDAQMGQITVDGVAQQGQVVRSLQDAAARPVAFSNAGAGPVALTVTAIGKAQTDKGPGGNGYSIRRDYYTPDGQRSDPDGLASGDRLVTVLTVVPQGPGGGRLMVQDRLPAGFEIDNPRLLASGEVAALDWLETTWPEHSEFLSEGFRAAVDWRSEDPFRLAYVIRAVTPGSYAHPAASVEDMYRPAFRAHGQSGRITVTE